MPSRAYETDRVEELPATGIKVIRLKSGKKVSLWDCRKEAEDAWTSVLRWLSRASKLSVDDWDDEHMEHFLDRMEMSVNAHRAYLAKKKVWREKETLIASMRNTDGRTPMEAKAFLEKADNLERELNEERKRSA